MSFLFVSGITWPEVSDTVPEFTVGTGLHFFIWSKSIARPGKEPDLCHLSAALKLRCCKCDVEWHVGYFGGGKNPPTYMTHCRNGGSNAENKHIFKGGPILNIYLNMIKKKYNCFVGVGGFIPRQRHRAPNKSKVPEGGMTAEAEEGLLNISPLKTQY